MKILIPNKNCFRTLSDLCPDPTITLDTIFFDYVVDSNNKYVLSDGRKITTTLLEKINMLYKLFEDICSNNTNDLWLQYYSKSYNKNLSSYMQILLQFFDVYEIDGYYTLRRDGVASILNTIYTRYYKKWYKLYQDYLYPLDRSEMLNPYEISKSIKTITDKMANKSTIENKIKENLSELGKLEYGHTITDTVTDTSQDSLQAFNSSNDTNTDKNVTTTRDSNIHGGTDNNTVTNENTINKNVSIAYGRENEFEQNINFKGNLGNITKQKLINETRELLQYQIYDTMMKDIDSVICRHTYGNSYKEGDYGNHTNC